MNLENKHSSPSSLYNQETTQETHRPLGKRAIQLLGAGAAAIALGAGLAHTLENSTSAESTPAKPQFEYVNDLPQDLQDQLLYVQSSFNHDPTLAPENVPDITLNQVGLQPFTIVDGAGGLKEQAVGAYLTEHNVATVPESVGLSINMTVNALQQSKNIRGESSVIHENDNYALLELKDNEGTDFVIVSPVVVDTN